MMSKFLYACVLLCAMMHGKAIGQNMGAISTGRMETFVFSDSKIFPGTVRQVDVYIPQQTDPAKPACLYVQQDGFDPKMSLNLILDTLIYRKEIPVTIGIFIKPGYVPPANTGTLLRPNRDLEYDGVSDNYVRFVLDEVIPCVTTKYHLNISKSGNDHCIGGVSSGGIAAFNAAWSRPDAFSRVYCVSGSFVSFRGGNELPNLVRKTDPKPIRLYTTAGTHDMENCAGDWTLLDMEMDKTLKFSGYEYQFHLMEGGHGVGWGETFGEAMRYLWKNWPNTINVPAGAPRVQDIILKDETWQLVAGGFNGVSGPACNKNGEVFFTDAATNKILKVGANGKVTTWVANAGHDNALSFGASGELYGVSSITGIVTRYDTTGKAAIYAQGIKGQYVLARPDGGSYITAGADTWLLKDGKKTRVDGGLKAASGIAMSPDRWLLAVADKNSHWAYSYTITPDGKLQNKEQLFWLYVQDWEDDSGTGAICYDQEGHLYAATRAGIQVCTWDGPVQVIMPLPPGKVTGICFGGKDMDTLYAFCGGNIYKRKLKTHGIGAFTSLIKMTAGKL